MINKELFEECIQEAISIGRKYMNDYAIDGKPTQQEWDLALVLLQERLKEKEQGKTLSSKDMGVRMK